MDLKTELQNFKVINLEEIIKNDEKIPDNMRNSIFLYNKAIESLGSGSEDIAIIELKKAISMNPQFYEAMNLLGICYSYLGDKEKAAEIFDRVIKAESNSILAMNYMQHLGLIESVAPQKNKQAKPAAEKPGEPLKRIRTNKAPSRGIHVNKQMLFNIARVGAGFAAGLLLSAILFSSLPKKAAEPSVTDQSTTGSSDNDMKAEYEAKYEAKYAELDGKYNLLQKDKESLVQQADYYKAALKLYEIDALTRDKKYENAADMLLLMKTVEFKDTEKDLFNELYRSVMPQAAKMAYDQGYKLYNTRKYQDTLKELEKVQVYDPQFKRMDAVLYYMGRSCQALQDSRSAVALFQKLITSYPNTTYAKSAKVRIKELTQIP